jgi:LmbE family N-acetylglucosaminyl deacetylase
MNPTESRIRKKLGEALMHFLGRIAVVADDDVLRELELERLREAVEEAAAQGIEVELVWHTLGTWSNDGPDRIACFTRALACLDSGQNRLLTMPGPRADWSRVHTRADCLFEIGRVHFHEGDPKVAEGFLLRALELAKEVDRLRGPAEITNDDRLEGRIAELLLQLPGDEGEE